MRYCVKCGAQVDETMNFCPSCGAKIPGETEQRQQNTYEYGNGQRQQNTYEYGNGQRQQSTYEYGNGQNQENAYGYGNGQYSQNANDQNDVRVREESGDRLLAVLSYLGLLVFVPLLSGNKSEFVKFHANQGLVLFLCTVLWNALDWFLSHFVWFVNVGIISIGNILSLGDLFFIVLMILGIANAWRSEKKELPLIGGIILYK